MIEYERLKQICDFCIRQKFVSYYALVRYAIFYRPDWLHFIFSFKYNRIIRECLKSPNYLDD